MSGFSQALFQNESEHNRVGNVEVVKRLDCHLCTPVKVLRLANRRYACIAQNTGSQTCWMTDWWSHMMWGCSTLIAKGPVPLRATVAIPNVSRLAKGNDLKQIVQLPALNSTESRVSVRTPTASISRCQRDLRYYCIQYINSRRKKASIFFILYVN